MRKPSGQLKVIRDLSSVIDPVTTTPPRPVLPTLGPVALSQQRPRAPAGPLGNSFTDLPTFGIGGIISPILGTDAPSSRSEGLFQTNHSDSGSPIQTTLSEITLLTDTLTDPPLSGTSTGVSPSNTSTSSAVTTPSLASMVDMHNSNKLKVIMPIALIIPTLAVGCVVAWVIVRRRGGLSGKKVALDPFLAKDAEGRVTETNALRQTTLRDPPLAKKGSSRGSTAQLENARSVLSEPETGVSTLTQREQQLENRLLSVVMQKLEAIEAAMQLPIDRPPGRELSSNETRDGAEDWNDRPPDYVSQVGATAGASPEGKDGH